VLKADQADERTTAWLKEHLHKSADFLLFSCDALGRHLPINDSWHTSDRALRRRAAVTLGRQDLLAVEGETPAAEVPPPSRAFRDAGIALMRSDWGPDGVLVALDASGNHSGHWHCGKPNLLIHAGGEVLAADPQMANYDDPSQPEYFKQAAGHNTVLVDGHGDTEPDGLWKYRHVSRPRLTDFKAGTLVDVACATTDGFSRLNSPVSFCRTVVFIKPRTVLVHDVLQSQGKHRYSWLLHLVPQSPHVDQEQKSLTTRLGRRFELTCAPTPGSSAISGPLLKQGKYHDRQYIEQAGYWFPLQYGDLPAPVVAAPCGVWTQQADGPAVFDFVLAVTQPDQPPAKVQRLQTSAGKGVIAYQIGDDDSRAVVLFDDRPQPKRTPVTAGGFTLNGRVGVTVRAESVIVP
jgi:hypothetical protein